MSFSILHIKWTGRRGPGAEGSFVEAGDQRGTAYQKRGDQAYIVCNYLLTFARNKQMMLLS